MNYEVWKKTKENGKSIASGHQLREPRFYQPLHAAKHGNASTVRAMGLKYPRLKQQTFSGFKLGYLELNKSKEAPDSDLTEIVRKKADRPTFLPENLMKKVIKTVINLRLREAPVSAAAIRGVARGVIIANHRSLFRQVLHPFEELGRKMTSRMTTAAKIPIAATSLSETKTDFQRKIKELQAWHEIPKDLIINFDQISLPYVCTGKRTYHTQSASNALLS